MKGVTIIQGEGSVVVAPAGDMEAFRAAAAAAVAAGPVRTLTTEAGIGLEMTEGTAREAGLIQQKRRARRAAHTVKE